MEHTGPLQLFFNIRVDSSWYFKIWATKKCQKPNIKRKIDNAKESSRNSL